MVVEIIRIKAVLSLTGLELELSLAIFKMAAKRRSQSPQGMGSRAQAAGQTRASTDTSASGELNTYHEERSSVNQQSADILSAHSGTNNLCLDSEPVISITDRRIKNLLAQTKMQKLMLDNHIKDLVRQDNRHKDYVAEGEQAEMLVDRAI